MLNILNEDLKFLEKYIDNIDELVLNKSKVPLLCEIDALIVREGLDEEYAYNSFGKKVQEIYDRVLEDNEDD